MQGISSPVQQKPVRPITASRKVKVRFRVQKSNRSESPIPDQIVSDTKETTRREITEYTEIRASAKGQNLEVAESSIMPRYPIQVKKLAPEKEPQEDQFSTPTKADIEQIRPRIESMSPKNSVRGSGTVSTFSVAGAQMLKEDYSSKHEPTVAAPAYTPRSSSRLGGYQPQWSPPSVNKLNVSNSGVATTRPPATDASRALIIYRPRTNQSYLPNLSTPSKPQEKQKRFENASTDAACLTSIATNPNAHVTAIILRPDPHVPKPWQPSAPKRSNRVRPSIKDLYN